MKKNNLLALIKLNFKNTISNKAKNKFVLGVIAVFILGLITIYEYDTYNELLEQNSTVYYFFRIGIMFGMYYLIFNNFNSKAMLFDSKDNDFILSLPISKNEIVLSKILTLILSAIGIGLLLITPAIVIFIINESINLSMIISITIFSISYLIIPTIISVIFGYITGLISSKLNKKGLAEVICNFILIIIFMLLYFNLDSILNMILNQNIMKYILFIFYFLIRGICTFDVLYMSLSFISILIIVLILSYIFSKKYLKIISNLNKHNQSNTLDMEKFIKKNSIKKALLKKELKQFFSIPTIFLPSIFFLIAIIGVGYASLFINKNVILSELGNNSIFSLIIMISPLFMLFSSPSPTIISNEGQSYWIFKTIPVSDKEKINAKKNFFLYMQILAIIVFLILLFISGYLDNVYELICSIFYIIMLIYSLTNYGIIINLIFPQFKAKNDVERNSSSISKIVYMVSLMILFIIFLLLYSLDLNSYLYFGIVFGVSIILHIITTIILNTWGLKRIKKIS